MNYTLPWRVMASLELGERHTVLLGSLSWFCFLQARCGPSGRLTCASSLSMGH
jgi:hypothetical protein